MSCQMFWRAAVSCQMFWSAAVSCQMFWSATVSCQMSWRATASCQMFWRATVSCQMFWRATVACQMFWSATVSCHLFCGPSKMSGNTHRHGVAFHKNGITGHSLELSLLAHMGRHLSMNVSGDAGFLCDNSTGSGTR